MTQLLELRNLKAHYQKVEALRGIDIEVEEGRIVCLIGANGAGKTTTLRIISGLKWPTEGEIWFKGVRIDRMDPRKIVSMGIAHVPEGRKVFPYMSVYENIIMGAFLRKDRKEINRDLEEIYGHFPELEKRHNQRAESLSGGEQQMLVMGRALMNSPKLLLLDEPTLGLSPLMVKEVANIIADINQNGVSILLVEQNARLALKLANRGYVLETGSIALFGDSDKLLNDEHVKEAYLGA